VTFPTSELHANHGPGSMSLPAQVARGLPLEVHVFEHEGAFYAFDARSYAILRLSAEAATVLDRMVAMTLQEIVVDLAPSLSEDAVRAYYLRFLEMIRDGVFSTSPVARPRRPPFNRLVVMLAGGCNMGCTYCFERDVPIYQNPNRMTQERADEVVDWFIASHEGPKAHVQFYGGEPLLNFHILRHMLERLEGWAASAGIEFTKYLITNGTLLNPERAAYLKEHGVSIQVSVDGDRKTHNRLRVFKSGEPTLDRIYPNIQHLKELGADFNLRAVLTRHNPDPSSVIEGLRGLGGEKVSFEVVASGERSIDLDDEDWRTFLGKYGDWVDAPYTKWTNLPHEMQNTIIRICEGTRVFYGCGAGKTEVTVAPDGSIYECQRIYREPYANVSAGKSPAELDSQFLTMVDDRPVCSDCWARYLCGGGCMQQSHVGHGSDAPLPQYCAMKRTMVEASIVKIAQLRAERGARASADAAGHGGAE
jgi:uncharacterized protein